MERTNFTKSNFDMDYYLRKGRRERSKAATTIFGGLFKTLIAVFKRVPKSSEAWFKVPAQ